MNYTVVLICLIIITISLVLLIGAMMFVLVEIRRLSKATEKLITHVEEGVSPALTMLSRLSEDIAGVTSTIRFQVERVDQTADHLTKNLTGLVETWTKTGYVLHDAVVEPLVDLAALLRGLNRGITFFFSDRKKR
jgi:predicted PurR-regulated permease PerM